MKPIQVQVTVTLDEAALASLAELLAPAVRQAAGLAAANLDAERDARRRASRDAIFAGETLPEDQGLLINSRDAARLLKVSPRTLWQMQTTGRMPPPVRIGRAVRWSLATLKAWVDAGCPVDPNCRSEGA